MTGWGGRAIRLGQWLLGDGYADYEHAFIVTDAVTDIRRELIVEAMPGGAQHVSNWHDPTRTLWLRCPEEHREAVAGAALGFVGVPYSVADYFSLAARRFHIPAPGLRRYIRSSGHLICSQLADAAADRGGWHLFDDRRWEGDVTPGDLARLARKQPATR
jgi:hypothetical protein